MKIGAYDIPVPDNTDPVAVRALIIPMIGFDELGFRLGYGGGYFDRTLAPSRPLHWRLERRLKYCVWKLCIPSRMMFPWILL